MKIIELTCPNGGKHDVGVLLTKKERQIFDAAMEEYVQKYKRKKAAKTMYNYMYIYLPI